MSTKQLHQELRTAGASADEARQLASLANKLGSLKQRPVLTGAVPKRTIWLRFVPALTAAVLFLIVGMTAVASAQTSLPGTWLYPIKRLSENTAVAFDPNYRATLMMRRAEEVKQLINARAGSDRVLATLSAYDVQAAAYKSTDYPAFAYCKSNLQQATTNATPVERQHITATLASLSDVD